VTSWRIENITPQAYQPLAHLGDVIFYAEWETIPNRIHFGFLTKPLHYKRSA